MQRDSQNTGSLQGGLLVFLPSLIDCGKVKCQNPSPANLSPSPKSPSKPLFMGVQAPVRPSSKSLSSKSEVFRKSPLQRGRKFRDGRHLAGETHNAFASLCVSIKAILQPQRGTKRGFLTSSVRVWLLRGSARKGMPRPFACNPTRGAERGTNEVSHHNGHVHCVHGGQPACRSRG